MIRGDLYRNDNGRTNNAFIEIHVGGIYFNTKEQKEVLATSSGCFTLNGIDAGDRGREIFMNDIAERYSKQTGKSKNRIYITVDRMR
jgi:hypothetical protein